MGLAPLAETGVDFLLAATLPALNEATGLALALAATGKPYIISFVARPEGTLLDGTPFTDAFATIDDTIDPRPLAYMINCTHASLFKSALMDEINSSPSVRSRVVGLFANTAALTPEELDSSDTLVEEAPEVFGRSVADLKEDLGMKILGGCCGTDERHIRALAERLAESDSESNKKKCRRPEQECPAEHGNKAGAGRLQMAVKRHVLTNKLDENANHYGIGREGQDSVQGGHFCVDMKGPEDEQEYAENQSSALAPPNICQ
jgi:hypothetical protein